MPVRKIVTLGGVVTFEEPHKCLVPNASRFDYPPGAVFTCDECKCNHVLIETSGPGWRDEEPVRNWVKK